MGYFDGKTISPVDGSVVEPQFPMFQMSNTGIEAPKVDTPEGIFGMNFLSDIGGLKGIASIASVIGGISAANDEKKWRKRQEQREARRVAREERRQEKFEGDMAKAWA